MPMLTKGKFLAVETALRASSEPAPAEAGDEVVL
jgi:hypothetical protein